jgi:hypothetical protein
MKAAFSSEREQVKGRFAMNRRDKIANIFLFLVALIIGLDAQLGWSEFQVLDHLNYAQCDIILSKNTTPYFGPIGMVLLPDGRFLVGGSFSSSFGIYVLPALPADGTCPTIPPTPLTTNGHSYGGMALGLDGKVYANSFHGGTGDLVTIDPNNGNETLVCPIKCKGTQGIGLALDPLTGDLYFTQETSGGVQSDVYRAYNLYTGNPNDVQVVLFKHVSNKYFDGLAWSCDGTVLLLASAGDNQIEQMDRFGNPSTLVQLPSTPDGIAFGAIGTSLAGYFFVNANDGTVYKVPIKNNGSEFTTIAGLGYRGDFVMVDLQGNFLLTQHDTSGKDDERITRLSSKTGGKWILPGSSLCSDLGCGAKAATTPQIDREICLSGVDAELLVTLAQSACAECGGCATLNQARATLIDFLKSLGRPPDCLDGLRVTAQALYQSCPCNPACVPPCASPADPNCFQITKLSRDSCIAKTEFPFGFDLESYDPILQPFMSKTSFP